MRLLPSRFRVLAELFSQMRASEDEEARSRVIELAHMATRVHGLLFAVWWSLMLDFVLVRGGSTEQIRLDCITAHEARVLCVVWVTLFLLAFALFTFAWYYFLGGHELAISAVNSLFAILSVVGYGVSMNLLFRGLWLRSLLGLLIVLAWFGSFYSAVSLDLQARLTNKW